MERAVGSKFDFESKIILVVKDEFNDCSKCFFDPETCDSFSHVRGNCIRRLFPVIFKEVKPEENIRQNDRKAKPN